MAVVLTDNRAIISDADATTGWTGSATLSLVTADPTPVESTGCLGQRNNNTTTDAYFTISATNLSNQLVYAWLFPRTVTDTKANGGMAIQLGDGTNRVAYHLAGDDAAGFRHEQGPTNWQCLVLDTSKLSDYSATVKAGARATLEGNLANITQVGFQFKATVGAQGNVPNTYGDIMRRGAAGVGLTVTGGSSGDKGTFDQISVADRAITDQKAHGILRKLGTGAFGVQGALTFGEASGSSSSWFEDSTVTVVFEDRGLGTDKYGITIVDNGTGTTTFRLHSSSIVSPSGVGAVFDAATDADVTDVILDACNFTGFTSGVKLRAGHEFTGGIISASGAVEANGSDMVGTQVLLSTVAANASALVWNVNTDPDGFLDNTTFSKGSNAHHAIEFGTSSPTTMTLRGVTFTGFNAANGADDSVLHIKRTSGTVTINIVGGTSPSYRSDGASVNIVAGTVAVTVTAKTTTGSNIENARVLVTASSGGTFPFEASVTIANSSTTATVTHTGHGLATNDKVVINGANHWQNNGVFQITVTDVNTYTYTLPNDPGGNPTGTITSTFAVLEGLTNASGVITMSRVFPSNQPITGRVRKSSGSPFFKTSPVTGTVSSSSGFSATVTMVSDE